MYPLIYTPSSARLTACLCHGQEKLVLCMGRQLDFCHEMKQRAFMLWTCICWTEPLTSFIRLLVFFHSCSSLALFSLNSSSLRIKCIWFVMMLYMLMHVIGYTEETCSVWQLSWLLDEAFSKACISLYPTGINNPLWASGLWRHDLLQAAVYDQMLRYTH